MQDLFEIIHEDAELLVVNKPADLVCHPTKTDAYSSLIGRVRLYLGTEATAHMVNRLDRETSGVVIVAKSDNAARDLRRLWESRAVEKEYMAMVHGHVADDHGLIDAPLEKDEQSRVAVKDCVRSDGAPSQTEYWVEKRFEQSALEWHYERWWGDSSSGAGLRSNPQPATGNRQLFTFLRVIPRTGRKHQIRIHLAYLGFPIVGDKLYGGDEDLYLALVERRLTEDQKRRLIFRNHALHARAVRFAWRGSPIEFACAPEPWLTDFIR